MTELLKVQISWDSDADDSLELPSYETQGSAGVDLRANIPNERKIRIAPGFRKLISTGVRIAIPQGYEAQVRPRSGLALKHGVTVLNSPGTIDSDYRGTIGVILHNAGQDYFEVEHGMRIAQMVIAETVQCEFIPVNELDETQRGTGGFGSTGVE